MAQFLDPNDPDKQKPTPVAPDSALAPLASMTAQPAAGGGTPAFNPRARQGAASSSGQFNGGYERLLNANQGVGTKIANRLTSNATQAAGRAQSAIGNATNTFNNAVDQGESQFFAPAPSAPAGPAPYNGDFAALVNSFARPGYIGAGGPIAAPAGAPVTGPGPSLGIGEGTTGINTPQMQDVHNIADNYAASHPTAPTDDPYAQYQSLTDPASYQPAIDSLNKQLASAAYTGPTTTNGYFDDAQRQALTAAGQLSGLGSVEGRQGQLGGSLLDSLLAGSQGGAQLHKAAQGAGTLGGSFGDALKNAQGRIGDANTDLTNYKNRLQGQLATSTGLQNQAQTKLQEAQQADQERKLVQQQYQDWVNHRTKVLGWDPMSNVTEAQFAAMTPEQRAKLSGFRA